MRIISLWALALALATSAKADDADWKAYWFVQHADGDLVCFYDGKSVSSMDRRARVWVKCVFQKELQDFGTQHREEIQANVLRKVNKGYIPPFATAFGVNSKLVNAITAAEDVADRGEVVQTRGRFFYELNCTELTQRRISAYALVDGKEVRDESPGEWSHLPPDSSGAVLAKMLCP
jgi:hypothetical protein